MDNPIVEFSLDQYGGVWAFLVQIMLLLGFLVLGNMLRRSIPFLRKSFIPSALIGGVLLALVALFVKWVSPTDYELVDKGIMKIVTYHALAIGFIAMTLKVSSKEKKSGIGSLSIQNGLITGATYMLQAVFGIITVFIFVWLGAKISDKSGIILPLAFGHHAAVPFAAPYHQRRCLGRRRHPSPARGNQSCPQWGTLS